MTSNNGNQLSRQGEVVLMTIMGGTGTLLGPIIGAGAIKYLENIFSAFNEATLMQVFAFLPEVLQRAAVSVAGLFVGEGWHLTLGAMFMLIVIFLPGGLMEGADRMQRRLRKLGGGGGDGKQSGGAAQSSPTPAE